MSDSANGYPQLKILGKITLPDTKTPRIQCAYCGKEGVIPAYPDVDYCRNQDCIDQAESVSRKVVEPFTPTDHSGTCSSCGGHTHYGYCNNCDDIF